MENPKAKLKDITNIILQDIDDYSSLTPAINELYTLFLEACGNLCDKDIDTNDYYLPSGKAIGPLWAGLCVKEILRTKKFLKGIYNGIKAAQKTFPDTKINILYAGTGPFATLAMPMTTLFKASEISYTLLEINPKSIEMLQKVIKYFDAEDYIHDIIQCDAAIYSKDKENTIHMVITETMQNALKKEPQVAITLNLCQQMHPKGILIPQCITVDACILNWKKNMERMKSFTEYKDNYYIKLGQVFNLDKDSYKKYIVGKDEQSSSYSYCFPEVCLSMPSNIDNGFNELNLFTNIQVFEDVVLSNYQCSLNLPFKLKKFDVEQPGFNEVKFQYEISSTPKFLVSYK